MAATLLGSEELGITLKTARGRGGEVSKISYRRIRGKNIGGAAIQLNTGYGANTPKSPPTNRQSLNISRPRRHSSKQAPSSPKKTPREMDVCFGLADHPGTVALHNAILECLDDFEDTPWGPPVYKAIRGHLDGVLFFIRTQKDAPWREASAEQRIERVRQQFELSRKKKKMKIIA